MKTLNKIFAVMALSATFMLTSCIEETFPEGGTATAEQVGASSAALEGSLNGIPAQMTLGYYVYESQTHETDMAYPQFMIAMTELICIPWDLTLVMTGIVTITHSLPT